MDEKELKEKLTPRQYRVMREGDTEPPFSGEYVHADATGTYRCAACGNEIFTSNAKFDSKTGWPSFDAAIKGSVELKEDTGHGMHRTEVRCARCHSHLGHLFDDGPTETGKRYCINSVCLDLQEEKQENG